MKKHIRSIIYGIALAGFTVYILMDTFVISRVYSSVPSNNCLPRQREAFFVYMSSAYCLGLTQYIETAKKIYVNVKKYLIFARKGFIIQS